MAERRFKLPGEEELNKDQDRVLALPEDGQYLVVGGPGTGKSVVALLRALKFQDNKDYIFLVYNHVLESATCQLINSELKGTTLVSLVYKLYWHLFKEFAPQIGAHKPDYDLIIKKISELDNYSERSQHLIIDEGQDMPPKYYEVLQYAGYTNFFIVADQNQQITEENSSRTELTNLLGLEVKDVIELKINYRNSNPIAIFANHFFTDKSSPAPDLPKKDSFETPVFYKGRSLDDYSEMILREADKDDRNLIGVVVANNNMRSRYYDKLNSLEIKLDNSKPIISSYSSSDKQKVNINFSQGGIVVLNDKSIKGLEFDMVFIVLDEFKIFSNDITSMKKRLYVMSSRAIKKLVLLSERNELGNVGELLPKDSTVLKISLPNKYLVSTDSSIKNIWKWVAENEVYLSSFNENKVEVSIDSKEELLTIKELHITGAYTKLPKELGSLTNLLRLTIKNEHFPIILDTGDPTDSNKWDCCQDRLIELPKEIGKLVKLEELYLIGNQLTALPKEIGALNNLKILKSQPLVTYSCLCCDYYVAVNQISCLPKEIGNLTNLEELSFSGNSLKTLPEEIGKLTNLKVLDLGYQFYPEGILENDLTELPSSICNLTMLKELYIYKGYSVEKIDISLTLQYKKWLKNLENNDCIISIIYADEMPF